LLEEDAEDWQIREAKEAVRLAREPEFVRRSREDIRDLSDRPVRALLIDEASMVSRQIYEDIAALGLPRVYIGDHGQLPPISDGKDTFNIMASPHFRLETLHRNAGPIAHFAEHLRKGGRPEQYTSEAKVQIVRQPFHWLDLVTSANQVICAFNRTRVHINRELRQRQQRQELLEKGDRIICLRNDSKAGLFNGQQGIVNYVDLQSDSVDFTDESGNLYAEVSFLRPQFGKEKYEYERRGPHPFDYAYALTCHKSQGSEWPSVAVLDQSWRSEYARWAYTAASRAKESLLWLY
jgi:exodeoxyribonuclease-5